MIEFLGGTGSDRSWAAMVTGCSGNVDGFANETIDGNLASDLFCSLFTNIEHKTR